MLSILKNEVSKGTSDNEILRLLNGLMNSMIYSKYGPPDIHCDERAKYRVSELKEIINEIGNPNIQTILDFGSAEGTITGTLAKELGLNKEQAFSTDIKRPRDDTDFTFILANKESPKISISNDKIDLITSLMVLHHLENPRNTIEEFYRILSPNGYLIIREHDCLPGMEDTITQQLDLYHGFYEAVLGEPDKLENPEFPMNYFAKYYSNDDWTKMIEAVGFKRIDNIPSLEEKYRMGRVKRNYKMGQKIKNPYYYYYAVYQKI